MVALGESPSARYHHVSECLEDCVVLLTGLACTPPRRPSVAVQLRPRLLTHPIRRMTYRGAAQDQMQAAWPFLIRRQRRSPSCIAIASSKLTTVKPPSRIALATYIMPTQHYHSLDSRQAWRIKFNIKQSFRAICKKVRHRFRVSDKVWMIARLKCSTKTTPA